jgi:GNAT superfamily N-acetyltransferase
MSEVLVDLVPEGAPTAACYVVMSQLRPHLSEAEFVERVATQRLQGYELLAAGVDSQVMAVAGFRILDNLSWGRFLYVDDLVTDAAHRSCGYGSHLMEWLLAYCQQEGIGELHLDSGVQRFGAHRFYLEQRMDITSHHFAIQTPSEGA